MHGADWQVNAGMTFICIISVVNRVAQYVIRDITFPYTPIPIPYLPPAGNPPTLLSMVLTHR